MLRLEFIRLGDLERALSYLQSGLSLAEGLNRRDDTARLRHRLGLVYWEIGEATSAVEHLEKAAALFESLDGCYSFKPKQPTKDELLAQTYRLLQKVLVSLERPEEALTWAERSRRVGEKKVEDSTHYSEIIDRQRGVVLYYRFVQ